MMKPISLGHVEPLDDTGELDDARGLAVNPISPPAAASITNPPPGPFGPIPSDVMMPLTPPLSPGACVRFRICSVTKISPADNGKRQNVHLSAERRGMAVHISRISG